MGASAVGGSPVTSAGAPGYVVRPIPRDRQPVLDRLVSASRKFQVHALMELDVSVARERIAAAEARVSWTGFVLASLARAVASHPEVNARRAGSSILYFDRVDVGATVERRWQGEAVLDVLMIPAADRLSCAEISELLHRAKHGPAQSHARTRSATLLARLPGPLRRAGIRAAASRPRISATFGPAVGVTSLGMFTGGWGWAVPSAPLTLIVTVGAVAERAVVVDGRISVRPMLPLTVTFDHAVVDGAPAARFADSLRTLVETAAALPPPRHAAPAERQLRAGAS